MRCQTTPRQAASRGPGNLVKGGYRCQLSPARKCRRKDDPSSCSPGKEILREVCSPPINLVPFLCRRSHAPLFMLPFFSSNWANPAKHHQHLQGSYFLSDLLFTSRDGWLAANAKCDPALEASGRGRAEDEWGMARTRVALAPRRPPPAGCSLPAGKGIGAYHVQEPRGQEGRASRQARVATVPRLPDAI